MILVTGSTGRNGQAVIAEFARQGTPVRALVRDPAKAAALKRMPGVEVIAGDMLRPESLRPALRNVARALMISSADPSLVEAQCTFIDAARSAGVGHVVKFSGAESGIGFRAQNFRFTRNHEQVERYLEASGMAWTHLRPSQFMQVYLREAPAVARTGVLCLPAGRIELSPVDVQDIAKVAYRLLTTTGHEGRRYEMTGPETLTMTQVAERISDATGTQIRYVAVSPDARRQAQVSAGMPPELADALHAQAVERLLHPQSRVALDAHQAFGVQPTRFGDFIQRHKQLFV